MINVSKLVRKIFTVLVILMPILEEYSFETISGTVADRIMLCLAVIMVLITIFSRKLKKEDISYEILPYLFYVVLNMLVFLMNRFENSFILDYGRHIILFVFIIFLLKKYFVMGFGIMIFHVVSFALSVYCLLQYIFIRTFGILLPSYLPFWEHRESLEYEADYLNYSQFYRPHAIFSEPSHFCAYVIIALLLALFTDKGKKKNRMSLAVFYTLVLCITGATTGIIGSVLVWVLYFVLNRKKQKKINWARVFGGFLVALVVLIFILKSSTFSIFLVRFFEDQSTIDGRIGTISFLLKRSASDIIFGSGYNYDSVVRLAGFLPGFGMCFAYFGIIGITLFLCGLFIIYKKQVNILQKALLIYILCSSCFLDSMFNVYFILYFAFLGGDTKRVSEVLNDDFIKRGIKNEKE